MARQMTKEDIRIDNAIFTAWVTSGYLLIGMVTYFVAGNTGGNRLITLAVSAPILSYWFHVAAGHLGARVTSAGAILTILLTLLAFG